MARTRRQYLVPGTLVKDVVVLSTFWDAELLNGAAQVEPLVTSSISTS
jgi:hypothetical protein